MIETVKNYVRFDIPDENGETRRERYSRLGNDGVVHKETGLPLVAPDLELPEAYAYLWVMYFTVSDQVSRIRDGVCGRIPPTEWKAWSELTGVTIKDDYDILVDMDEAYCIAMNELLQERREAAVEAAKKKGK